MQAKGALKGSGYYGDKGKGKSKGKDNFAPRQWNNYNPGFMKTQWNQWRPGYSGNNGFGQA